MRIIGILLIIEGVLADCPHGWFHFGNKCFKVVTDIDPKVDQRIDDRSSYRSWRDRYDDDDDRHPSSKKKYKRFTFDQAVLACQAFDGGTMVTIHSPEEQNFLTHLFFESLNIGDVWIGITQVAKSKRGRKLGWVDGSPYNFSDWFPGEPRYLTDDKLCATMFSKNEFQGKWFEHECGERNNLVCQTTHEHDSDRAITREMHLDTSPFLLAICIMLALILSFTCYLAEFPKAQQLMGERSNKWFTRTRVTRENSVESGPKFDNRF